MTAHCGICAEYASRSDPALMLKLPPLLEHRQGELGATVTAVARMHTENYTMDLHMVLLSSMSTVSKHL